MYSTVQAALKRLKKLVKIVVSGIGVVQCKAHPCIFDLHDTHSKQTVAAS